MSGVVFGEERDNLNTQLIFAGCRCPGLFGEGGRKNNTGLRQLFFHEKIHYCISYNTEDFTTLLSKLYYSYSGLFFLPKEIIRSGCCWLNQPLESLLL